ncbi:MAG: class I SAM-dependent methyltransferase, partial [Chloroflexota bacterium]
PRQVLDIGCNDGTLLGYFPPSVQKYGIDPSDVAAQIEGDVKVIQDIFPSPQLSATVAVNSFDIVTSIAMFYDLEDPVGFVKSVKQYLSPDGIWVFEMSYMPLMLKMSAYDTICQEHLEYYSLAVIEHILKKAAMRLLKLELNEMNGGSLRCFAVHDSSLRAMSPEDRQTLSKMHLDEFDLELETDKPYEDFGKRILDHREQLRSLLFGLKQQGKKIHVYGASTKGNTILQFCGIDHHTIDYAAERNPDKYGAVTLGTDIPIISEAESRAMKPDFYLVLPWHFREEFLERERETLETGIAMIFPLPSVEIVSRKGADDGVVVSQHREVVP